MADFLFLKQTGSTGSKAAGKEVQPVPQRFEKCYGKTSGLEMIRGLSVYGLDKTYRMYRGGNGDSVVVLGACYFPGKSIEKSLEEIAETFQEANIAMLKRQLAGQYILMIQKDKILYMFSDNWGVRSIFYSEKCDTICSSLPVIEEIKGKAGKLDEYKVFEYLAIQYVLYYPGWISNGTLHKEIRMLRPFEYIVIDTQLCSVEVRSFRFQVDNRKENDKTVLSDRLIERMGSVILNPAFRDQKIGATLTGGYDSRLVVSIANTYYDYIEYRIGVSDENPSTKKEAATAKRLARLMAKPLHESLTGKDTIEDFEFLTSGMSPVQNHVIASIIQEAGRYELGFGGCFGTEAFKPLPPYQSDEEFIAGRIERAKSFLKVPEEMWQRLESEIRRELELIRHHYLLLEPNYLDSIHILYLLNTGVFSTFMLSPYNIYGMQVEPYAHYSVFELALQVPLRFKPGSLWVGGGFLQKEAMTKINPTLGKVLTTHSRPMLPCTLTTFGRYFYHYFKDKTRIYSNIFRARLKKEPPLENFETIIDGVSHIPNGTEVFFKKKVASYCV